MPAFLEVVQVAGIATVQDGGRPGQMRHGVPPGGALVPELLAMANHAVGNAWRTAALECFGRIRVRLRGRAGLVAVDGRVQSLRDGEEFEIPAPRDNAVCYLAVDGGVAVPEILGGRGTLFIARLGGFEGRALQQGDLLALGDPMERRESPAPAWHPSSTAAIRVIPGPDAERLGPEAVATFLEGRFVISPTRDRVGLRLAGPQVTIREQASGISAPMVRGAVQVPPSGEPIVLGPDHPTTGGYPVIAVVIRADLGALAARRPGAAVSFQSVSVAEARGLWRRHAAAYFV